METKMPCSDAFKLIYDRYIKDDPARVASFQEELTKTEIPREIYDLRERAGLSGKQLAALVGTTETVIEDIEEADYEGDFAAMASRIIEALRNKTGGSIAPAHFTKSPEIACSTTEKP